MTSRLAFTTSPSAIPAPACFTYSDRSLQSHPITPFSNHRFSKYRSSPQNSTTNTPVAVAFHHQQSSEESPQPFHNHRVCCDHQFTDRCSEHGEPYPPAQLTSPTGPTGFARWRFVIVPAPAFSNHTQAAHPHERSIIELHCARSQLLLTLCSTESTRPRALRVPRV